MSGEWYVHCGCPAHGDHGGCDERCAPHGCRHPVGVVLGVDSRQLADELRGKEPPRELVLGAVRDRIREIRRDTNREVDRLIAVVEKVLKEMQSA